MFCRPAFSRVTQLKPSSLLGASVVLVTKQSSLSSITSSSAAAAAKSKSRSKAESTPKGRRPKRQKIVAPSALSRASKSLEPLYPQHADVSSSQDCTMAATTTAAAVATMSAGQTPEKKPSPSSPPVCGEKGEEVGGGTTGALEDDKAPFLLEADLEAFMSLLQSEKTSATPASAERPPRAAVTPPPLAVREAPREVAGESCAELSPDQAAAVEAALRGENLFITGGAGTGKSLLIREILAALRDRHGKGPPPSGRFPAEGNYFNTYVTATTGVAALNVGGMTINAFSGVNFNNPKESKEVLFRKIRWPARKAMGRWAFCRTLIIDEISMMEPDLFDKINFIAKEMKRRRDAPFGGIQVILCGDFLQLPPVTLKFSCPSSSRPSPWRLGESSGADGDELSVDRGSGLGSPSEVFAPFVDGPHVGAPQYCFQTQTWQELKPRAIVLETMHRHGEDTLFQRVLADIRKGRLTPTALRALEARRMSALRNGGEQSRHPDEAIEEEEGERHHVRLFGTNREVDRCNAQHFAALSPQTEPHNFLVGVSTKRSSHCLGEVSEYDSVAEDAADATPYHVYFSHDVQVVVGAATSTKKKGKSPARRGKGERKGDAAEQQQRRGQETDDPQEERESGADFPGSHRETRAVLSPLDIPPPADLLQIGFTASSSAATALNTRVDRHAQLRRWQQIYINAAKHFTETNLQPMVPLKPSTKVMLLTNVSTRLKLVNGSVGEVSGFLHPLELVELMLLAPREHRKERDRALITRELASRGGRHAPPPKGASEERQRSAANPRAGGKAVVSDSATVRAEQLLKMGGFQRFRDVFRCVDTSLHETLFGFLRSRGMYSPARIQEQLSLRQREGQPSKAERSVTMDNRMDFISYGSVFGEEHLENVMRLVGLRCLSECLDGSGDRTSGSSSGSGALQHPPADGLFLRSFAEDDLAAMRLPIVRFHLEALARRGEHPSPEKKGPHNAPFVYAFVAPHTYTTNTDAVGGYANGGAGAANRGPAVAGKYFSRTQLPLRHAWAVTVHKAQGLTLPSIEVDASRFFSPGQAYVALSRATSLEGVRLVDFHQRAVRVCPIAKAFHEGIEGRTEPNR